MCTSCLLLLLCGSSFFLCLCWCCHNVPGWPREVKCYLPVVALPGKIAELPARGTPFLWGDLSLGFLSPVGPRANCFIGGRPGPQWYPSSLTSRALGIPEYCFRPWSWGAPAEPPRGFPAWPPGIGEESSGVIFEYDFWGARPRESSLYLVHGALGRASESPHCAWSPGCSEEPPRVLLVLSSRGARKSPRESSSCSFSGMLVRAPESPS
jgi:hypothetical protein